MTKNQLRIDMEPKHLLVVSEPYVTYTARGYQPVIDVIEKKTKNEFFIFISAVSISKPLELLRQENNGSMIGLEFWVNKKDSSKMAAYEISE